MRVIPEVKAPVRQGAATQYGRRLTDVEVLEGLPPVEELYDELLGYSNVLLGRADPPMELNGFFLDLMEVAAAYYARAKEIDMHIHWEEQNRRVIRGSPYYKFRTGQLRSFIDMSKMMAELGSRRLTLERMMSEQRYDSGE